MFQLDCVGPPVTEIVFVKDFWCVDVIEIQIGQADLFSVNDEMIQNVVIVEFRCTDNKAADNELVQMGIGPAERGLDEFVHLCEIEAFRNKQGAPDRRGNISDGDGDAPGARRVEIEGVRIVGAGHDCEHGSSTKRRQLLRQFQGRGPPFCSGRSCAALLRLSSALSSRIET